MKFFNFLSLIFDSVFRFRFCFRFRFRFRDSLSVSGFRIPCFSAAPKAREEVLKGDQSNEENLDEPELTPRIRKKQTTSAGE